MNTVIPVNALVLAAGLGTRLMPYSARVPKPLIPVLDRSLLEHQFAAVREIDGGTIQVQKLFVNAHHLAEQVQNAAKDLRVDRVFVEETLLGTGGPLQQVYEAGFCDELLVLNGDCYHDFDLKDFVLQARLSGQEFALLCVPFGPMNLECNARNQICGRDGKYSVDVAKRKVAFSGISWYSPKALKKLKRDDFNVVDFWAREASAGNLPFAYVVKESSCWIDMGSPQGLFDACKLRLRQLKKTCFIDETAECNNAFLNENAMVQKNAIVGNGSQIQNALILPNTKIQENSVIKNRIVGPDFTWEIT